MKKRPSPRSIRESNERAREKTWKEQYLLDYPQVSRVERLSNVQVSWSDASVLGA